MTRLLAFQGAPDERQGLMDSIAGFTTDGAFAEFAEGRKGILQPGAMADVVVLTGDIEAVPPDAIDELRVAATICGGRITYERGAS
jgi:predicted amidohydrolase YtcJ